MSSSARFTQKKDPTVVSIYKQSRTGTACGHLKTISEHPPKTMEKRGKVIVRIKFTMKQLLLAQSTLDFSIGDVAIDQSQLEQLTPRGKLHAPGFIIEARSTGHVNDSPITILCGLPDITRTSFKILKELSEKSVLPADIEARLESSAPLLTMMCPPTELQEYPALNRAMRIARERYGMHLYSNHEDGSMLVQNPKAMIIIDECIGVNKSSLENTYVKDAKDPRRRYIHTPGDSLISAIVRTYPPSAIRLVWDDQNGRTPFDVTDDVMFRIPEDVANHAVNYILRRAKIVSGLYIQLANTKFSIQASSMHGNWEYNKDTNTFLNTNTERTYDADREYEIGVEFEVVMRYVIPDEKACAITTLGISQFYPMPVWASSDIVNGKLVNPEAKPLLNLLHDNVYEKLDQVAEHIETGRRKRSEAMLQKVNEEERNSGAASSSAVDDE